MFAKFLYNTTDITFTLINLILSESSLILGLYFHKSEDKKINLISRNSTFNLRKFINFHLDQNYPSSHP